MGGWEGGQGAPRGWGVRRCQPKIGSQSGDDVRMTSCVGEVVRVTFLKIKRAISKKSTLSIVYSYGHATHRKKSRPSSTLTHPPLARLHVETPRREVNISEVLKRDPAYHAAGCVRLLSGDKVKGGSAWRELRTCTPAKLPAPRRWYGGAHLCTTFGSLSGSTPECT